MRILYISGYDAWTQVSKGLEASHHLYGIHQLIERYEVRNDGSIYGVLKSNILKNGKGGEVDFYQWPSVKKDVCSHIRFLLKNEKKYDLIYDCLNRGSIWIGLLKRFGLLKARIITVLHHPSSYWITLFMAKSDAYIFFNNTYKEIAVRMRSALESKFYVNEWYPDTKWYQSVQKTDKFTDAFFIDNGKSERDRELMISVAQKEKIAIDYAGNSSQVQGYARSYKVGSCSHTDIAGKLKSYGCVVIPIKNFEGKIIGPLGITSFLDCIALGIPVITSDNTCFANEVKRYNLGISYRTGEAKDLADALQKMHNDVEFYQNCKKAILQYREGRTIDVYSNNLAQIINNVMS